VIATVKVHGAEEAAQAARDAAEAIEAVAVAVARANAAVERFQALAGAVHVEAADGDPPPASYLPGSILHGKGVQLQEPRS
jgi:hypothetical protein